MIVLYIILGIIIGVPAYLLFNAIVFGLFVRLIAAIAMLLWPSFSTGSSFMNEIKGGPNSLERELKREIKFAGWGFVIAGLVFVCCLIIYRICWLIYRGFRAWLKLIKLCWNLGTAKKKTRKK